MVTGLVKSKTMFFRVKRPVYRREAELHGRNVSMLTIDILRVAMLLFYKRQIQWAFINAAQLWFGRA